MILNLKQVRFKRQIDDIDNETVSISLTGKEQITAGDFQKFISGFQVLNPDLVICNLDPKVTINMEITIEKGRGYVPAEEMNIEEEDVNLIPIDAIFTPIKSVKFNVENVLVTAGTAVPTSGLVLSQPG